MGRIKSNAVDRLPNNKHPNMKTSTLFVLAASCALLASGASAEGPEHHDDSHHDPCKCRDSCEYVNGYHICYVRDPHACHDAFPSRYYEDEKWIWCPWEEEHHHESDWKPPSKKKHDPHHPDPHHPDDEDNESDQPNTDESQPDESKPDESKPDESQPDESLPDESQPEESQPEESQPDESQPEESQPEVKETKETKPEVK